MICNTSDKTSFHAHTKDDAIRFKSIACESIAPTELSKLYRWSVCGRVDLVLCLHLLRHYLQFHGGVRAIDVIDVPVPHGYRPLPPAFKTSFTLKEILLAHFVQSRCSRIANANEKKNKKKINRSGQGKLGCAQLPAFFIQSVFVFAKFSTCCHTVCLWDSFSFSLGILQIFYLLNR